MVNRAGSKKRSVEEDQVFVFNATKQFLILMDEVIRVIRRVLIKTLRVDKLLVTSWTAEAIQFVKKKDMCFFQNMHSGSMGDATTIGVETTGKGFFVKHIEKTRVTVR